VIEVKNLTKRYGEVLAVDGIDFTAPAGATIGLLGGNGAGKNHDNRHVAGVAAATTGSIRVLGHDMLSDRFRALAEMNFPRVRFAASSPHGAAKPARLWHL